MSPRATQLPVKLADAQKPSVLQIWPPAQSVALAHATVQSVNDGR
jgi:hypothetical protein